MIAGPSPSTSSGTTFQLGHSVGPEDPGERDEGQVMYPVTFQGGFRRHLGKADVNGRCHTYC